MTMSGAVARPMLAGIFVYGGLDALRNPESKAKAADDVAPMIAAALGLPTTDTVTLVRVNGGIQLVAGTMLALGKARRVSALVLAASLVPTTYAGHRFWEEVDEERRAQQRIQFLKNVAMLGGLVLAASDTGGRPSLPWQARRAAHHAIEATVAAGVATQEAAKHLLESTEQSDATPTLSKRALKAAQKGGRAEIAEIAEQAHKMAQAVQAAHAATAAHAAKGSDLSRRAVKAARKAAKKAAKKARKAELTRRARKAVHKAAQKAEKAELTKRALRAARRATKKAKKAERAQLAQLAQLAQVAPRAAAAAAGRVQQATADTIGRARELAGDVTLERARGGATTVAREIAERAKEALPIGS